VREKKDMKKKGGRGERCTPYLPNRHLEEEGEEEKHGLSSHSSLLNEEKGER